MLKELKANRALELFAEMSEIPHGSSDTKKISDYLKDFALKNNLEYFQDASNNIVINKAASLGKENATRLIMQAHMDMVCEKEEGVEFDFETDSLNLKVKDDFLYAEGTTLGADDISGVALELAVLEDKNLSHGPITCIFTVDEEIGMLGATALDKSCVQGEAYLLNIDNEAEGHFLTSCAGGIMAEGRLSADWEKMQGSFYELTVSGCSGGHSGETINRGSANAVKVLGELLFNLSQNQEIFLSEINGGLKDNAIPRKASAIFTCENTKAIDIINTLSKDIVLKFKNTDPELDISIIALGETKKNVMRNSANVISYIYDVPNGVIKFSENIPGMVETSLNLGVLRTDDSEVYACHLLRSSVSKSLDDLLDNVFEIFNDNNFVTKSHSGYPAWEHKKDSKFRQIIKETADNMNFPCKFEGIHAGLECGIFFEANPKLDIVSFGPDIFDIHTPSEKMSISSFNRCYEFVKELIQNID